MGILGDTVGESIKFRLDGRRVVECCFCLCGIDTCDTSITPGSELCIKNRKVLDLVAEHTKFLEDIKALKSISSQ